MSVYADVCDMKEGTPFRNVNDSTGDPEIESKDWIELWEDRTKLQRGRCCACGVHEKTIVGGHIVLGSGKSYGDALDDTAFLRGSNRVFIAPICTSCNGRTDTLRAEFSTPIVHLLGYGIDSRFDEGQYAYDHPGLSMNELRVEIAREKSAYARYLWQNYKRQKPLHGRDRQILDSAVPSLHSKTSYQY